MQFPSQPKSQEVSKVPGTSCFPKKTSFAKEMVGQWCLSTKKYQTPLQKVFLPPQIYILYRGVDLAKYSSKRWQYKTFLAHSPKILFPNPCDSEDRGDKPRKPRPS